MKTLKKWATMIGAVIMLVSIFSFAAPMPKVAYRAAINPIAR